MSQSRKIPVVQFHGAAPEIRKPDVEANGICLPHNYCNVCIVAVGRKNSYGSVLKVGEFPE